VPDNKDPLTTRRKAFAASVRGRGRVRNPALAGRSTTLLNALFLALALSCGAACAQVEVETMVLRGANKRDREAYFGQSIRFWGTGKYPDDPSFLAHLIRMSSGRADFVLWRRGKTDPATGAWLACLGMCRPSSANWYQNGFYDVVINGRKATASKTEAVEAEGGAEGRVAIAWDHPDARVVLAITLLADDDKLLLETVLEPRAEFAEYQIRLLCYPSCMKGGYRPGLMLRKREACTPTRALVRPENPSNTGAVKAELTPDEPWVLFYDNYFDPGLNRGDGPCAACWHPGEAKRAAVSVGNYNCDLTLTYPRDVASTHLVLWDFGGTSNRAAKAYMGSLEVSF